MSVIYKYALGPQYCQRGMPSGAKPLSVQTQDGKPVVWMMIPDPHIGHYETWSFDIVPTGDEWGGMVMSDYLGTFQLGKGFLVFHVFCRKELTS